jgi:4'-phosphopantetheinyl transferase
VDGHRAVTRGTVHVWTVALDADPGGVPALLKVLSGEERVRAARLRTTELRLRFIAAHGALRRVLARYLETAADAIRFETTTFGKPFVVGTAVSFNLSHSDGLALCAVTVNGQVGVDVERIRPVTDADDIVKRYFAPLEAREYARLPPSERPATFFSTWTRKEAFLKATGLGVQRPLDSFEVEVDPGVALPKLTILGASSPAEPTYCLRSFTPRSGYAAAIALDREIDAVEFFDWTNADAAMPLEQDRRRDSPAV